MEECNVAVTITVTVQPAPFVKPHFVLIAAAAAVLLIDGALSSSEYQSTDSYASINPSTGIRWLNCYQFCEKLVSLRLTNDVNYEKINDVWGR